MASRITLVVLMMSLVIVSGGNTPQPKTCDAAGSDEESCLLQSGPQHKKHLSDVKVHQGLQRCAHLDAAIEKEASKQKVNCMSGRQNGEPYCDKNSEVTCPGSNQTCSGKSPCCKNPCPGVPPYGNADTFPCPSVDPKDAQCASDKKVEDCLDPCAPTENPTASPTQKPTLWVCNEDDLKTLPFFKQEDMACSGESNCYGKLLSSCTGSSTCYATQKIQTCGSNAHCCAGQRIETCESGATCWAKSIGECKSKATCIERPKWTVGDD